MSYPMVALCHFCELHGPRVVFMTEVSSTEHFNKSELNVEQYMEVCEGCTSVSPSGGRFCTADSDVADRWYCSQSQTNDAGLSSLLQQACSRSLSCEVYSGPEGVMYFGDDVRGHVISYNFALRDVHARGLQRRYSIVVMSMDKHKLLGDWTYYCRHLKRITADLQSRADQVFESEEDMYSDNFPSFRSMSQSRLSKNIKPSRQLTEIVGSQRVYRSLHQLFTLVLRQSESRFVYPARTAIWRRIPQLRSASRNVVSEESRGAGGASSSECFLRRLRSSLTGESFRDVIAHVLLGNQLIVRGVPADVIRGIDAFRVILPEHLYRVISFSGHYVIADRCNLLGVSMATQLPDFSANRLTSSAVPVVLTLDQSEAGDRLQAPPPPSEITPPTLVGQIHALVATAPAELPDSVLQCRLETLLSDWIGRADVLRRCCCASGGHIDPTMTCDDLLTRRSDILVSLQCLPADIPLLVVWMGHPYWTSIRDV